VLKCAFELLFFLNVLLFKLFTQNYVDNGFHKCFFEGWTNSCLCYVIWNEKSVQSTQLFGRRISIFALWKFGKRLCSIKLYKMG